MTTFFFVHRRSVHVAEFGRDIHPPRRRRRRRFGAPGVLSDGEDHHTERRDGGDARAVRDGARGGEHNHHQRDERNRLFVGVNDGEFIFIFVRAIGLMKSC